MEHCRSCHNTFNNTRAGDKHRSIDYIYAVIRWPNGKIDRIMQDYLSAYTNQLKDFGVKVISENNQHFVCLSPEKMREKGMAQEKNGSWNMGGRAYIPV